MKKTKLTKRLSIPLMGGIGVLTLALTLNQFKNQNNAIVQPVDPNQIEENDEIKKLREEYENSRHGGTADWRERDLEFRKNKALQNSMSRSESSGTYANGALEGNWSETGSANYAGRIRSVFYDQANDLLYAGSEGGVIWRSDINGTNWIPLNDNFNMYQPMYISRGSQGATNRLFVISDAGPLYSDNEGGNWATTTFTPEIHEPGIDERVIRVNDASKTMFMIATQKTDFHTAIYTSVDNGQTFNQVYLFPENMRRRVSLWSNETGNVAYCLVGNKLNTISTSGVLTEIGTLPFTVGEFDGVELKGMESQGITHFYALYKDRTVYSSSDGGVNWIQQGEFPTNVNKFSLRSFEVSAVDPNILYLGSVDGYKSVDKGANWTKISSWTEYYQDFDKLHADIPHVLSMKDNSGNELTFFATDGGLYKTYDSAATFTNVSKLGLHTSQYYACDTFGTDESVIYAGSQDQGGQQSLTDNGSVRDFDQFISGDNGVAVSTDDQAVWQTGYSYVFYLPNGLTSRNTSGWGSYSGISNKLFIPQIMEDPSNPQVVYLGGGNDTGDSTGRIFKFTQASGSVSRETLPYVFDGRIHDLTYSQVNSDIRYVSTNNRKIYRSDDAGATWNEVNSTLSIIAQQIITSSINEQEVIVCGSGYVNNQVFRSVDGGVTFTSISTGMPATLVNDIAFDADESLIFAATEVGPYVYVVSAGQWYDLSQGNAPDQRYTSVEYLPLSKKARFSTYGRGIFDFNITAENTVTDVVINIEAETFTNTGGTINDAVWGGPGLGVNNAGSNINWVNGGDWAEYAVSVSQAGTYIIEYQISSPNDNANISFYLNDNLVSTDAVVNNGQWDAFQVLEASNTVDLTVGVHTVRVEATGNPWQWNLDNIRLTKPGLSDPIPPVVEFTQPVDGTVYTTTDDFDVHVTVDATDEDGTVASVALYFMQGVNLVSVDTEAPYEWNSATDDEPILDNLPPGTYTLIARATDNDGIVTEETISFTIEELVLPPAVSFTQPVDGDIINTTNGTADIPVVVDATDADGSVNIVTLYLGDTFIGDDFDAPYEWNDPIFHYQLFGLAAGTYELRAVATDNEGNITEETITVTIQDQSVVIDPIVIEAETFTSTGGTINDAVWGGPGLGVNNAGSNINWVNSNDWATYSFDVVTAAEYEVEYLISSPNNNAQIQLFIDDVLISTDNVTNNGEWDNYYAMIATNTVNLTAGTHTVRIVASGSNPWQWNLDKITLSEYNPGPAPVTASVTTVPEFTLGLYPNPAEEYLTVAGDFTSGSSVEILSSNGVVVLREQLDSSGQQVFVGDLPSGVYVLTVNSDGVVSSEKFIKK